MNNLYKLPAEANPDKVFLVNRSELEGRIDSFFYSYQFKLIEETISKSIYPVVLLRNIMVSITNGYDFRDYKQEGTPYIKVANVKQGYFDFKDIQYIDVSSEDINKKIQLEAGNLLLTRKGTYGTALSLDRNYDYIISSEIFYIKLKQDLVNSKYLEIFFNTKIGQQQFERVSIGAIMGSLSQEALKNVSIPLSPLPIQQQIVDLYQEAYKLKQQKEAEAKALLDSIDDYILGELDIILPEKDNSLEKRIFTTQFSEVAGGRLDPSFIFNSDFKIENGIYKNERLKDIAILQKGQSITSSDIIEGDYPVIAGGQSSPYKHNVYNHTGKTITVSASGAYSGYVWYHDYPIFASDCIVIKSKNESKISTLFLSEILKLKQQEIYNLQQGAGQPHVYASDLGNLLIPVPEEGYKQNEIAEHIQGIRQRAKLLQEEAKTLLDEAKQQVEQMILGD